MARQKRKPAQARYDPEFRVKVIKTSLEKNLSAEEALNLFGVGQSTWWTWKRVYREQGEDALRAYGKNRGRAKKQLHPAIQEKLRTHAVEVKRKYPFFGVLRVWQWMLRTLFLPVSFRQVRQTLAEANLIGKVVKKKRKPRKPRRFERARPNEMWAVDITQFDLAGGQSVWVIAFIDDYSRYIVSWGLYAGCVTELVLEVLRKGIAVFGRPNEILSDHGPQFWVRRGRTQFQKFLQREDITHILANTPQSNGKIEAFWGTMKREFVERTKRKGDLEEVRDRLAHWLNFYNFQRPHTEINCTPAERFFKYQAAMKAEIQKRIRKNEAELALSKTPPSQVIGQTALGETPVEVRKEGDQFIVRLGDQVMNRTDLDPNKEDSHEAQEGTAGGNGRGGSAGEGESVAGADDLGGGEVDRGGVPGDGPQTPDVLQVGGADGGGDAGRGQDAGAPGQAEGSPGGGDEPGSGDGPASAGAPAALEPDADLKEAPPGGNPETPEKRPGEAQRNDSAAGAPGDAGAGAPSGPSSPASDSPGLGDSDKEG